MYFANQKNLWRMKPYLNPKTIELKMSVAKLASDLIGGGGFDIMSTDDSDTELLKEIGEYNSFSEMFYTNEMDLSQRGNLFATVEMVKGKPAIITDDPRMISSIGRSYVETEVAVIYKNVYIDARAGPIKEVGDRQEVNRYGVNQDGQTIQVDAFVKKVPNAAAVPMKGRHGLGYVPVVHFKNRPGAHRMYSQPDDYNTGCLNKGFNQGLTTFNEVEVENNVTRLFARMDKKDRKQIIKEAKDLGIPVEEYIRQRKTLIQTDFNGDKSGDAANASMQLIQGNLPSQQGHSHFKNINKMYYELCGYSYQDPDKNSGIGGASGLDVIFTNKSDVETTKSKISVRQPEINFLLKIVKDMVNKHGIGVINGDLTIDIKTSLALDSTGEVEKSAKKLEMGTTSRIREVMKLERVSRKEAEEILSEADADMEAKAQMEQDMAIEQIQAKPKDSESAK